MTPTRFNSSLSSYMLLDSGLLSLFPTSHAYKSVRNRSCLIYELREHYNNLLHHTHVHMCDYVGAVGISGKIHFPRDKLKNH